MADAPARKLAVILHADVMDSTRMVQLDEAIAHQRIQTAFHLLSQTVEAYAGIAHEIRGDALLAEFARASDAVCAGLAFQIANEQHNATLDDDIRPELRIGISLGEIIIADGTLTGEGVVLAQRLEQCAAPGEVVTQSSVAETVPSRMPFEFVDLGPQQLKGFDQPVSAQRIQLNKGTALPGPEATSSGISEDQSESGEVPSADRPSIAVLPFTNMSGDSEQEYFSDGITEDIITALSCISGLLVTARNSTMIYKDKPVDIKEVGREQGVQFVLEGSVRKSGDRVRVTAQLIDAGTGHHLWADRYDRNLDDIFAVQDEITHKIMVEMRVKLSLGEKARMLAGRTESAQAWERQLKADELNNRFTREANHEARKLIEEALELDPNYVSAWTELGWTYCEDVICGWTDEPEQSMDRMREIIDRTFELEPEYPFALSLQGYYYLYRGDYDKAVEVAEKAVDLAPSNAESIAELAHILVFAGDAENALETIKNAIRITPMGAMWHFVVLGICYYALDQQDRAIATLREAIAIDPGSPFGRIYLAAALVAAGQTEEANQVAMEVVQIERNFSLARWRGAPFVDSSRREQFIENLVKAGFPA